MNDRESKKKHRQAGRSAFFGKKVLLLAGACMLLLFGVLTGCTAKEGSEEPELLLGFSQLGSESAWRVGNTRDIEKKAGEYGISLMLENANQKQENQIAAIRRFIAYKVDVIAFSPIVEEGWDNVLKEAKDAGIPVITMNYGLGATGYALGQVITDRHDPVLTLAAWYAEEAGEESRYLILTGEADGLAGDSITAFRDGLRKAANVEEVLEISAEAEEEEELYEALSEAFSEEDVDTAVCCDSSGVRAVLDVLDGEDLTDIRILCLNGDGAGEELLDGDIDMAVIKPSEELAKQAAVLASAYLKNGNTGTAECMYREAQLLYYDSGTEELAALRQGRKAEE